ncbi:MAG: amino acid--tRNA ligase-related protein, partial [Terriglobia bacterium]
LMERLFALIGAKVRRPFPILPYDMAMERYGSDKPHTGFGLEWKRISLPEGTKGKIGVIEPLKGLCVPGGASASRSQTDKLQEAAEAAGIDWFSVVKLTGSGVQSPLIKALGYEAVRGMAEAAGGRDNDLAVFVGMKPGPETASALRHLDEASGEFRLQVARRFDLIKPGGWNFLWVVDFPMFEYDAKEKRFSAMHHPFTSPREADLEILRSEPGQVKARAYDLVLNGSEIGGGSIRTHRRDIQQQVFEVLGMTPEKARARFGFFLDALEYGTPPHGGIALGYDRIIALMAGESNIREVIAFPKTASAVDVMCDAPSPVDPEQLEELGLEISD